MPQRSLATATRFELAKTCRMLAQASAKGSLPTNEAAHWSESSVQGRRQTLLPRLDVLKLPRLEMWSADWGHWAHDATCLQIPHWRSDCSLATASGQWCLHEQNLAGAFSEHMFNLWVPIKNGGVCPTNGPTGMLLSFCN